MLYLRRTLAGLICLLFGFGPAHAITLINRDQSEQKLVVIEGDKQSERLIKAGEKIELCAKSCVIRLGDSDTYEFEGTESVTLEDGYLFLD